MVWFGVALYGVVLYGVVWCGFVMYDIGMAFLELILLLFFCHTRVSFLILLF